VYISKNKTIKKGFIKMFNLKIKNDSDDIEVLSILSYETSTDPNKQYCVFINFYSNNKNKKISYILQTDERFKTTDDINNALNTLLNKVTKKKYMLNVCENPIRSYISIGYDNGKNTSSALFSLQFTGIRQVL
jgi:hypothetical protein